MIFMRSLWAAPLPVSRALPINAYIDFAQRLADAAGDAIRPFFRDHGDVESKGDHSPVTQADKAAELAMREIIRAIYPDHGIFGEELGVQHAESRYVWVLDPIDGTRNFIAGGTQWGTLIALCENGVPILGVLDQPITGERWLGAKGQRTMLNGKDIHSRNCPALKEAVISTTHCAPNDMPRFEAVAMHCANRIDGGDCYAYGMLARGERDIVCDTALKPYDILALVPIIEGAGGKITGWDGAPITLSHYATAIAMGDPHLAGHGI